MKKLSLIIIGLVSLITVSVAFSAESIKYDFDDVEVKYAAEFTAKPVSGDENNMAPSWIVQIAGGVDKPITVLYGVVNLKNGGETQLSEEFIKVVGEGGSERFLLNSASSDLYEGTSNYKDMISFFWSAKKLVGDSVVKDFTPPLKSITLYRTFNESQQLYSIMLSFTNAPSFSRVPIFDIYEADISTLNQSGVPTATTSQ